MKRSTADSRRGKAPQGYRKPGGGSAVKRGEKPAGRGESWKGTVERLSWGGKGLARAEDGRLILLSAPFALFPGEEVEAEVTWKARHGEGRVTGWTRRDPRRVAAGCPVAGLCGGCDLWEAGPEAPELKRQMAADLFRRQLGDAPFRWIPAPVGAARHRIQVHWDGRELGFMAKGSHRIVPVAACPAAAEPVSRALPRLREALEGKALPGRPQRWELATGTPADAVFAVAEDGRAWRMDPDGFKPTQEPTAHLLGGLRLTHRTGGFFQVCAPWAAEAFGGLLRGWDLRGDVLYDLYGGVGLFSAMLGDRFHRRVLVEFDAPAVEHAKANLEALGLPSECVAQDVGAWLPEHLGGAEDLVLLDPPRAGLAPEVAEKLLTARAGRMVLVGCDGAAFCRDLKRLEPVWAVKDLAVLDLFPNTVHVEAVALLERR